MGDDDDLRLGVGERVLFPKYAGTELRLDGADHLVLEATDLLAVVGEVPATA